MSRTCMLCKETFDEGGLDESVRDQACVCPACADRHARILRTQFRTGTMAVVGIGLAAMALLLGFFAAIQTRDLARKQQETNRQEAVFRYLLTQGDMGRLFQIIGASADGRLTGTVLLKGLSVEDLDRMSESSRVELLNTQLAAWQSALQAGYGSAPTGNTLKVMVMSATGDKELVCYGNFVGGKWNSGGPEPR